MRLILFRRIMLQELERRLHNKSITKSEYEEYRSKLTWANSLQLLRELRSRPGFPALNSLAEWIKANWVDVLRALIVIAGLFSQTVPEPEPEPEPEPRWYGLDD